MIVSSPVKFPLGAVHWYIWSIRVDWKIYGHETLENELPKSILSKNYIWAVHDFIEEN
jgi:hypothetical protein